MLSGKSDIKRLLAVLNHEKAGGVPNFEIVIDPLNATHLLGEEADGLWSMPPQQALRLAEKVGQDAIPCVIKLLSVDEGTVCSHDDMDRLAITGIDESVSKLRKYLAVTKGTGVGVCAVLAGPLTAAYMAAGPIPIESFMMMIYDEPELVDRLLNFFTSYSLELLEATKDIPFSFYYIGDDVSGFMSPEHLDRLWAPRHEQIIRAAQATNRPILCHCCGKQSPVLPHFSRWGVNAVHPLQPDLNDIYKVSEKYPELCLVGNIDVSTLLSFGSPDEVVEDVQEHLDRLGRRDGGYVVGSSHSIIDSVKPENYMAMLETTWKY